MPFCTFSSSNWKGLHSATYLYFVKKVYFLLPAERNKEKRDAGLALNVWLVLVSKKQQPFHLVHFLRFPLHIIYAKMICKKRFRNWTDTTNGKKCQIRLNPIVSKLQFTDWVQNGFPEIRIDIFNWLLHWF